MKLRTGRIVAAMAGAALTGTAAVAFVTGPDPLPADLIVFTQVAAGTGSPDGSVERFPMNSRIVALDPTSPDADLVILSRGFAAARAPDVHFDGRRIVFAGQREAGGPWQIWEMDLARRKPRLWVPSCDRCADPVYRADNGVVFVAPAPEDEATLAIHTVGPGEKEPRRITHHPSSETSLGLVSDGRIIVATRRATTRTGPGASPRTAPTTGAPEGANEYRALRHDGTGAELMYRADEGAMLPGRVYEAGGRELVFVERATAGAARIVRISQAYPASTRRALPLPDGRIHSVFPAPDGSYIASYRDAGQEVYGLRLLTRDGTPGRSLVTDPAYHALEPVRAAPRPRPLGFVSPLDPASAVGTLFGLDARLTGLGATDSSATTLRVRTRDGVLGEIPLATDGSFHLELPADVPLLFETLNDDGTVVRGPSAWIWVRPGEVRGCVGCHEDRALAPENRVPMAITGPVVRLTAEGIPEPPPYAGDM